MLLVLSINSLKYSVALVKNTTDVEEYFGMEFPYILDYRTINISNYKLILANKYQGRSAPRVAKGSCDLATFNNVLSSIGVINYNENQNNPDKVQECGGNCQAYTLLIDAMCKKCGLKSSISYTDRHMFNNVELDGNSYSVDVTKNKMIMIGD